ncbi:MAG: hypothetical protein ICV59_06680 [Thermoleophilia bacterium]|nr:hypothetical protein [Thermoleophilia bacterium]
MRERRCFVQFIHPGGEHWPDQGDLKFWNRDAHRRKFLKGRGRYLDGGDAKEGEIVFWGEWEPESKVVARYTDRVPDGPRFLYEPFFDAENGTGAVTLSGSRSTVELADRRSSEPTPLKVQAPFAIVPAEGTQGQANRAIGRVFVSLYALPPRSPCSSRVAPPPRGMDGRLKVPAN